MSFPSVFIGKVRVSGFPIKAFENDRLSGIAEYIIKSDIDAMTWVV
jgi:hypothetical protein